MKHINILFTAKKIYHHKGCMIALVVGSVLFLWFDNITTVTAVGIWRGSSERVNMEVMNAAMRGLYAYQQAYRELPDSLNALYDAGGLPYKKLYGWIDREAASPTFFVIDTVKRFWFARHVQLLYFLPPERRCLEKLNPGFILLAEPYPFRGERNVYRVDKLNEDVAVLYRPEKLSEAEFQRQIAAQHSVPMIYRQKDDRRPNKDIEADDYRNGEVISTFPAKVPRFTREMKMVDREGRIFVFGRIHHIFCRAFGDASFRCDRMRPLFCAAEKIESFVGAAKSQNQRFGRLLRASPLLRSAEGEASLNNLTGNSQPFAA